MCDVGRPSHKNEVSIILCTTYAGQSSRLPFSSHVNIGWLGGERGDLFFSYSWCRVVQENPQNPLYTRPLENGNTRREQWVRGM